MPGATLPPVVRLNDFSGGLNLRDSQPELGQTDLAKAYNVTLDERGAISGRLGHTKWNSTSYGASPVSTVLFWGGGTSGLGHTYTQVGAGLYQDLALTPIHTFTTSDRVGMCDFQGTLCVAHPVDGFFTWDGVTFLAIAAGPKADSLAVWQNRVWSNDKSGTAPSRINFSDPGNAAVWGHNNDIRENDNQQVVNVFGTGAPDFVGRPTLLVFKSNSTYRIYDSTTGAYQTLDIRVGTAGALSVTALLSKIITLSPNGIYETDGVTALKDISDKIRPLFDVNQINTAKMDLAAAGAYRKHAYFSLPKAGATVNNLMLDYDPISTSFTFNSNAASCYAHDFNPTVNRLLMGSPTVNGQLYQMLTGGTDDGTSISSVVQTRFTELNSGMQSILNRARVNGRGTFTIKPLYNYDWTETISRSITIADSTALLHGGYQDIYDLGRGNAFAFRIDATGSTTPAVPFGTGDPADTRTAGAWALYGIDLDQYSPLGRS